MTAKGVQDLAKALPKCKITWDGGVIEPTASLDPDRRAAEYVLSIGGTVRVNGNDSDIRTKADLPTGTFRLTHVGLNQNKQVTDSGLAEPQSQKEESSLMLAASWSGVSGQMSPARLLGNEFWRRRDGVGRAGPNVLATAAGQAADGAHGHIVVADDLTARGALPSGRGPPARSSRRWSSGPARRR